jgi:hypothetical protein
MMFAMIPTSAKLAVMVVIGLLVLTTTTTLAFQPLTASPTHKSHRTTTTQLQYANTPPTSSHSSFHSDHERFRQAIAAAAAARSMYYQNEMTVQELDQVRASFELLVQRNHLYYSSGTIVGSTTTPTHLGLEVYYPEGVIHPASTTGTSSSSNSLQRDADTTTEDIDIDDDSHHHLLLTSAGRRLRELEIQLLESMRTNDDGIDQLVHLWTTERNAASAHALLQMQNSNQICSQGLVQEEADLAELCRNYPGWAEPWSRLATLLFYKGVARWSDALSAAEEAIRIKPWHFEALNVCTLILTQMDHPDNPSVIFGDDDSVADLRRRCHRLSRLSLPKLDKNSNQQKDALEARHMWVSRAVATAQHQLQCAEQYTAAFRAAQQRQQVPLPVSRSPNDSMTSSLSAWQ